jgi:menaquinone-dependent protoporphyrinogen oxidase
MKTLVAYASRHGATREIAEWIAGTLLAAGEEVTIAAVTDPVDVAEYEAFVIGSAAYMGHWLGDATAFVRRHRAILTGRPVWLFSSGPVGDAPVDPTKRQEMIESSRPLDFDEFDASLRPRDEAVFFGAWDRDAQPVGLVERIGAAFMRLPVVANSVPFGDYRDRPAVEAWAVGIARDLRRLDAALPEATSA